MITINKVELEEQFILRLPQDESEFVRSLLKTKPKKLKKHLKIELDPTENKGIVYVNNKVLFGVLKKFPTIIESYKTYNKVTFLKTADICQFLDCTSLKSNDFNGLAPPMKNVKTKRFRKCLINKDENAVNVQKELFYLIQADLEAVHSKFEIINAPNDQKPNNDIDLFGDISDVSESTLSNTEDFEI